MFPLAQDQRSHRSDQKEMTRDGMEGHRGPGPCPHQLLQKTTLEPGHTFKEVEPIPSLALYQKSC